MHRFYVPTTIDSSMVMLADVQQLHHLRDVLRLKAGDAVSVFDAAGNEYLCTIASVDRKQAILAVSERRPSPRPTLELAVGCAIPKHSRMDDIIDKLTQLGVDSIFPLLTERGSVRLEGDSAKLTRWQKIALSASQQSQRHSLPRVRPAQTLAQVIRESSRYELRLIPTLLGETVPLRAALNGAAPRSIIFLIGPEGDFSPAEVELAVRAGFKQVSLGQTVLRVDTAAIAVASYLKFALG